MAWWQECTFALCLWNTQGLRGISSYVFSSHHSCGGVTLVAGDGVGRNTCRGEVGEACLCHLWWIVYLVGHLVFLGLHLLARAWQVAVLKVFDMIFPREVF